MGEDQATLGRFAGQEAGSEADDAADPADDPAGTVDTGDSSRADRETVPDRTADAGPVCPWCLAPESAFEDGGPTGRSCGRCSAALPVGADWFLAGELVARRPMYEDTPEG